MNLQSNENQRQLYPQGGLKLDAACAYLGGVSNITPRRLIKRGLIKRNNALRHIIISKSELDRFLTEN